MSEVSPTSLLDSRHWRRAGLGIGAVLLMVVAWLMTGEAPKATSAGVQKLPPPLVERSNVAADAALQKARRLLRDGKLRAARTAFADIVAANPQSVDGQIGLALSRWRDLGPVAVLRDLEQLGREYPDDALVPLEIGLVKISRGDIASAATSFRAARATARRGDVSDLSVARVADNLLHPDLAPGYPPLLVDERAVPRGTSRSLVAAIKRAIGNDDRVAAARTAARAAEIQQPHHIVAVARAVGAYSKDAPEFAVSILSGITVSDAEARALVELHRGLVLLWSRRTTDGLKALRSAAQTAPGSPPSKQARTLVEAVENRSGPTGEQ